ncbi:MAG: helix-turn-helix transcriptional regulator [Pseudomonadota bacterium]
MLEKLILHSKENFSPEDDVIACDHPRMKWHESLKSLFDQSGLSIRQLSEISGVSYASCVKYLAGKVQKPRGDTLDRIAQALGSSEEALTFGRRDEPDEPTFTLTEVRNFIATCERGFEKYGYGFSTEGRIRAYNIMLATHADGDDLSDQAFKQTKRAIEN